MGTTAKGLRYPEPTDRVADGYTAIKNLASDVDAFLDHALRFRKMGIDSGAVLGANSNGASAQVGTFTLPVACDVLFITRYNLKFSNADGSTWEVDLAVNIDNTTDFYTGGAAIADTASVNGGAVVGAALSAGQHTVKFRWVTGAGGAGSVTYRNESVIILAGKELPA